MLRVEQGHADGVCFDDPFSMLLYGFPADLRAATLKATLWDDEHKRCFECTTIVALTNGEGEVRDGALLLSQLRPVKAGDRFNKTNVVLPCMVQFACLGASVELARYILRPGDVRQPVDVEFEGLRIYGTLFIPAASCDRNHRQPAVFEIGGSAGGLLEVRSALICSRVRRPTFALAWYLHKTLPSTMCVPVEYVIAATRWLLTHKRVAPERPVSIYTISKGTELAFLAASQCSLYDSIVAVGPQAFVTDPSLLVGGKLWPAFAELMLDGTKSDESGFVNMLECFDFDPVTHAAAVLPCNLQGVKRVLFICGSDDQNLPAMKNATLLAARLSASCAVEVVCYPGAGHLIEPPSPHCDNSVSKLLGGAIVTYGGSDVALHSHAKMLAWEKTVAFLDPLTRLAKL